MHRHICTYIEAEPEDMGVDLDKWIEKVKKTEYLAEDELKALCEYVSRILATNVKSYI